MTIFGYANGCAVIWLSSSRAKLRQLPTPLRVLKAGFDSDGLAGVQELAGNATASFYMSKEGQDGRRACFEMRAPNFIRFKRRP